MPVRLLFVVAFIASGCGNTPVTQQPASPATLAEVEQYEGAQKTSTDPAVNANARVMAEFKTRVDEYADLHTRLAKGDAAPRETADPAKISASSTALAAKVLAARAHAKHGDIFTPEIRTAIRSLLAPKLKGETGHDAKAVLKDDAPAPGTVPFKVNAKYPEGQPMPTVPANLLLTLPSLPSPLEYRVVGQHLLLLDTSADLIVDYILNAITT